MVDRQHAFEVRFDRQHIQHGELLGSLVQHVEAAAVTPSTESEDRARGV